MFDLDTLEKLERAKQKQLVATLGDFLANAKNNSLTDEEARKNLEEGVIELVKFGEHSSNGLLVSDDGYFLTARHCVESILPSQIVLYDGTKCRVGIGEVCVLSRTADIALVKADVPGNAVSRNYRFETNEYLGSPTTLFTRWNEKLVKKYGLTGLTISVPYSSLVPSSLSLSSIPAEPGDSGGVVATKDYKITGFIHGLKCPPHKINQRFDFYSTLSVHLSEALNFIDSHKYRLESCLKESCL